MNITLEQAKQLIPSITQTEGLFLSATAGYELIKTAPNGEFWIWINGRKTPKVLVSPDEVATFLDDVASIHNGDTDIFWYSDDETITDAPIEEVFEDADLYDYPEKALMAHVETILTHEGLQYDLVSEDAEGATIVIYLDDDGDIEITLTNSGKETLSSVRQQLSHWISLDDDYYDETRNLADPYDNQQW